MNTNAVVLLLVHFKIPSPSDKCVSIARVTFIINDIFNNGCISMTDIFLHIIDLLIYHFPSFRLLGLIDTLSVVIFFIFMYSTTISVLASSYICFMCYQEPSS
jgi:hypothetical protein